MKVKATHITMYWHTDTQAMDEGCEDTCSQEECEMPSVTSVWMSLFNEDEDIVEDFHCHVCLDHTHDALIIATNVWRKLWNNNKELPANE